MYLARWHTCTTDFACELHDYTILLSFGTMFDSARMGSEQWCFTLFMQKVINYPDINEFELNVVQ